MRMSPAELVAHHEPLMTVEGTRVSVTFRDQGPARAFRDGLVDAARVIPARDPSKIPAESADQPERLRPEQLDDLLKRGDIEKRPFDAEQIVRGLGFLVTLARQVLAKPGEAVPSAVRLTLDLGKAMGVPLPTRQDAVAVTPQGTTVKSGLLPYGATSIPAVLDPETV